ncbi:MAG: 30S ribosome-binding factor RbfA [Clostridiales bacterium]|nr:30S ribosome-binding factor RbfA [Clostridiales bacterium]
MSAIRTERINGEIMKNLSAIIPRIKGLELSGMVSVMRVDTDSDLKHAKVYISVYGGTNSREDVVAALNNYKGAIKRELSAAMKSVRSLPDIHFLPDGTLEYSEHINKILSDINKKS